MLAATPCKYSEPGSSLQSAACALKQEVTSWLSVYPTALISSAHTPSFHTVVLHTLFWDMVSTCVCTYYVVLELEQNIRIYKLDQVWSSIIALLVQNFAGSRWRWNPLFPLTRSTAPWATLSPVFSPHNQENDPPKLLKQTSRLMPYFICCTGENTFH